MPKTRTDRDAMTTRATVVHDVHDIRSLTDTGGIALLRQRPTARDGVSAPKE